MDLVLTKILPRLPAKSLIRFKCVSKSFKTTISSQRFSNLYHRHKSLSSDTKDLLILSDNERICSYDLDSHPLSTISPDFIWTNCQVSVVGSSNGLLCIFVTNENIQDAHLSLINPVTNICKHINLLSYAERVHTPGLAYGFALDHVNLDFKIVNITDEPFGCYDKTRTTRVYSVNSNSWGVANFKLTTDSIKGRLDGALINGHLLHWVFCNPSMEDKICCFDVCKMKWVDNVLLPCFYYCLDHKNKLLDIGVFDDRLFSSFENHVDSCFDVWVMKDYRVQDSWFKLFSIPVYNYLHGGLIPVCYRTTVADPREASSGIKIPKFLVKTFQKISMAPYVNSRLSHLNVFSSSKFKSRFHHCYRRGSSEILIRQRLSSRLFWYNSVSGVWKETEFLGALAKFSNFPVYTCSMSLVHIPCGKLFSKAWSGPGWRS